MCKTLLMIAFHYPPCATSSGLQRTLSFSRHLEQYGWRPIVLSVRPGAYERTSAHQLADVPSSAIISRSFALDAARHLAIRRRYWSRLATPDRWRSWWLTAVPRGLSLIQRHSVNAIWSTYPIATAHTIGATLARLSQLPWIADFRDPMVEVHPETGDLAPRNPVIRNARLRIEAVAARRAARLVFCTDGARNIVRKRYPGIPEEHTLVISNGYEERAFEDAAKLPVPDPVRERRLLLHSGTIYPGADRDPTALFRALEVLRTRGEIAPENFELRLRDPSNADYFRRLADSEGIGDLVTIAPAISYREALAEMLHADGLLLLQGITSNPAVPAKLYEYMRAGRPIIALVHPQGESARTLRDAAISPLASLTDSTEIGSLLSAWLNACTGMSSLTPARGNVAAYSRQALTAQLSTVLNGL